jgi:acetyltransferase-like isoleucine patch superfamily enzyme
VLAEIRVPRETVNDDTVTVQEWHAAHGTTVRPKQHVVSIETSKAVLEVESEAEGYLQILHAKGAEVPIGELIGRVLSEAPDEPGASATGRSPSAPPPASVPPQTNGHPTPRSSNRLRDRLEARRDGVGAATGRNTSDAPGATDAQRPVADAPGSFTGSTTHSLPGAAAVAQTISKKAQALLAEHAIDPAQAFPGLGLVREVDVIRHLERRTAERLKADPLPPSPAEAARSQAAGPAPTPRAAGAKVDGAYVRPKGLFGDAAASAKDRGNRSVLWLAWNYLWRNWFLGHMVRVAPRGVILKLHRWRGVKMGQDVFIDPTAIVETAFPENITIGNDVRITAGCVIMSHIKAPHYLRETGLVPVVLKPVVLEDHCFIGVNSVIMPGVTVGKASVVTSGSVVVTNVPPYTMVQGNPAKVIKQFPRPDEA